MSSLFMPTKNMPIRSQHSINDIMLLAPICSYHDGVSVLSHCMLWTLYRNCFRRSILKTLSIIEENVLLLPLRAWAADPPQWILAGSTGALSSSSDPSSETVFNILYAAYGAQERRTELIICPVVWNSFQHFIRGIRRSREAHWAHHLPRRLKQFSTFFTRHMALKIYDREYWMIYREDQAFSPSYDLALPPPPAPVLLPLASCLFFSIFLCVAGRAYTDGRGRRGGRGAESYDRNKAWVLYKSFNTLWSTGSMHSLSCWTLLQTLILCNTLKTMDMFYTVYWFIEFYRCYSLLIARYGTIGSRIDPEPTH